MTDEVYKKVYALIDRARTEGKVIKTRSRRRPTSLEKVVRTKEQADRLMRQLFKKY